MLIRLECRNMTYTGTVFYWTVEPEVKEIVSNYGYIVEISEGIDGPWDALYTDPIYAFGFIDKITVRGMVDQRIYYRIKAIDFNSNIYYSNIICLSDEEPNFITSYIKEQEALLLRRFNGQDCLHFARRKFGDRCPICYDAALKKSILPKCRSCFGTTYKNGYFAPVLIRINTDPKPKQINKNDYGVSESMSLGAWTSGEYILENDDVLIILGKPSERYLINGITPTSINGDTVRQILTLNQVREDHPAQLLNDNIEAYTLNEFNIFRREWKQS